MWPVSNPGHLTFASGALPASLRGSASKHGRYIYIYIYIYIFYFLKMSSQINKIKNYL